MHLLQQLDAPLIQRIGWTLLHGLWQGTAIALILAALLPTMRSPRLRYAMACAALLMTAIVAAMTFASGKESVVAQPLLAGRAGAPRLWSSTYSQAAASAAPKRAPAVGDLIPMLVRMWMIGVIVQAARQGGAWLRVQGLRRGRAVEDPKWLAALRISVQRLGVRRLVRLVQSTRIDVPAVLGIIRPVILVPVALLNDLSAEQAGAVLAHELAHIRRFDYGINLLQTAIETIFFHHPAVWWIGAQIRRERENCCDDIAAAVSGGGAQYAGALLRLEERRGRSLALAASDGSLLGRIRRLLGETSPGRVHSRSLLAVVIALLCVLAPLGFEKLRSARADDVATTAPTDPKSQYTFYHVTIGEDGFIAVNAAVGNWQTLRDQLAKLPAAQRAKVVIALSAETEDLTVGEYFEAQAQGALLVKDLGLAYLSNTGVERHSKPKAHLAYVGGTVARPGVYDITSTGSHRVTIRQLIIAAGGINPTGAPAWIDLIRRTDGAETFPLRHSPIDSSMNAASLDLYLQPDDSLEISTRASPTGQPATAPTSPGL